MKNFLALMLVAIFLFVGCGGNSSSKTETPPAKETSAPKELTPEPKAADEKHRAEEQANAEQKSQDDARRQAEQQAEEERRASLLESGVQLSYTIEKVAEGKYKVSGTTNLPDGMELSIELGNYWIYRREVMGIQDEENYEMTPLELQTINANTFSGQAKRKVNHGTFEATFSNAAKLVPGRYELSIISIAANLQPKEVQNVLGDHGKNLFGTYVVDSKVLSGEKLIDLIEIIYLP